MAERPAFGRLDAHKDWTAGPECFFPTPPWAARAVANFVRQLDPLARSVWEPACGAGHMVHALKDFFPVVHASDAYPYDGNAIIDFLAPGAVPLPDVDWVFTNVPFDHVEAFVRLAYARARRGVAFVLRTAILEGQARHQLLKHEVPLTIFAPFSERVPMHKGRWEPDGTSAAFYSAYIWLKPELRPHRYMARIGGDYWPATRWLEPGQEDRWTRPEDAVLFGAADRIGGQLDIRA